MISDQSRNFREVLGSVNDHHLSRTDWPVDFLHGIREVLPPGHLNKLEFSLSVKCTLEGGPGQEGRKDGYSQTELFSPDQRSTSDGKVSFHLSDLPRAE